MLFRVQSGLALHTRRAVRRFHHSALPYSEHSQLIHIDTARLAPVHCKSPAHGRSILMLLPRKDDSLADVGVGVDNFRRSRIGVQLEYIIINAMKDGNETLAVVSVALLKARPSEL